MGKSKLLKVLPSPIKALSPPKCALRCVYRALEKTSPSPSRVPGEDHNPGLAFLTVRVVGAVCIGKLPRSVELIPNLLHFPTQQTQGSWLEVDPDQQARLQLVPS